jgi:hypothetical protein
MDMDALSQTYLAPLNAGVGYPEEVGYSYLLNDTRLDFSVESLSYVDLLLDSIRSTEKPEFGAFISTQENQTFLFILGFYVGAVIARNSDQSIRWFDYDAMLKAIPDNAVMFPKVFHTTITCQLSRAGFFVPLSSVCSRLFEEPVDKSVRFSAEGFMGR